MSTPITPPGDLPRVSISEFKANPVRYSRGVMVTNHGKDQFVFLPVASASIDDLDSVKSQLLLLAKVRNPDDVARELREIADSRSTEFVGDPQ